MEAVEYKYRINEKDFLLKTDYSYQELEWLDVVMGKLQVVKSETSNVKGNEVRGEFTRDELEKTLKIILEPHPTSPFFPKESLREKGRSEEGLGFEHEDFLKCTEGIAVKIIADFFLQKAVQGIIIKSYLMN